MKKQTVTLTFYDDDRPNMIFENANFQFRQGGSCDYIVVFQDGAEKVTYIRQEYVLSIIVQS